MLFFFFLSRISQLRKHVGGWLAVRSRVSSADGRLRPGASGGRPQRRRQGELKKKINQLLKFDLLIIDELGYLPMNKQGMHNLFQLINAMYEYRSIILTTNKEFTHWGEFFFDGNVAVPIVDRIIHHSHIFMLGGESYRLKSKLNK